LEERKLIYTRWAGSIDNNSFDSIVSIHNKIIVSKLQKKYNILLVLS
jgi:hypothetical protein